MFMPTQIVGFLLRSLFAVCLLALGIGLTIYWYEHRERAIVETPALVPAAIEEDRKLPNQEVQVTVTRIIPWHFGMNAESACLIGGVLLLFWSLGGGWLVRSLTTNGKAKTAGTLQVPEPVESLQLKRPDGCELQINIYGAANLPVIVFTHGWGLNGDAWHESVRTLSDRYRIVTWDLPGLGRSTRPADRDWGLEKLAAHLNAVINATGTDRPVILAGHSIGGMITLTYCKQFPEMLGVKVKSLIITHSTYTNPTRTTSSPAWHTALQKPVLEPISKLMVWISPVFRLMNWMSYWNGSAHRSSERDSFAGQETKEDLDFVTQCTTFAPPDVIGHGFQAMFRYDATATLGAIKIPVLVVCGEKDQTCAPAASIYMSKHIPKAELCTLPAMKHCGYMEKHRAYHAAILSFLSRTQGLDDHFFRESETMKPTQSNAAIR